MRAFLAVAVFILILPLSASGVGLWGDGFEAVNSLDACWTGYTGAWVVNTNSAYAHGGIHYAKVSGGTSEDDALWIQFPTTGYSDLSWSYWYKVPSNGPDAGDFLYLDWSGDAGLTWQNLATYGNLAENSDWIYASHQLPPGANNNPAVVLRVLAVMDGASEGVCFDDFSLETIPEPATGLFGWGALVFLALLRRQT